MVVDGADRVVNDAAAVSRIRRDLRRREAIARRAHGGMIPDEDPFYFRRSLTELGHAVVMGDPLAEHSCFWMAARLSYEGHKDVTRKTGEPYFVHPLKVARILGLEEGYLDEDTINAALLHDRVEDVDGSTLDELEKTFSRRVARLVNGVTKLAKTPDMSREARAALSLRKFIQLMHDDLGVVAVKSPDRLHNMRTAAGWDPEKRREKAEETLLVYVPITQQLNWHIYRELGDLSFAILHPEEYAVVKAVVDRQFEDQQREFTATLDEISAVLRSRHLAHTLRFDRRGYYEIWLEAQRHGVEVAARTEILNVEIKMNNRRTCFAALEAINALYIPLRGMVRDAYALPHAGARYLGLRPEVRGIGLMNLRLLDPLAARANRVGFLADDPQNWPTRFEFFLDGLMDTIEREGLDVTEIMKGIRRAGASITVLTPRQEPLTLEKGATVHDAAFRISPRLGIRAVGATVDQKLVPLNMPLDSGQQILIIPSGVEIKPGQDLREVAEKEAAGPIVAELSWYDDRLVTPFARNQLAKYFLSLPQDVQTSMVDSALDEALDRLYLTRAEVEMPLGEKDLKTRRIVGLREVKLSDISHRLLVRLNQELRGTNLVDWADLQRAILCGRVLPRRVAEICAEMEREYLAATRRVVGYARVEIEVQEDRAGLSGDIAVAAAALGLNRELGRDGRRLDGSAFVELYFPIRGGSAEWQAIQERQLQRMFLPFGQCVVTPVEVAETEEIRSRWQRLSSSPSSDAASGGRA